MDAAQLPDELRAMAEHLGVDVNELLARVGQQPAATEGIAAAPAASHVAAIEAGVPGAGNVPADVADGVTAKPAETETERLQRELAVSQQELQQTRKNLQTIQDGRVIGSAGLSGPVVDTPPNLGGIEPGIRFAVRNGLIAADALEDKLGPIIVDLFKQDLGGVI